MERALLLKPPGVEITDALACDIGECTCGDRARYIIEVPGALRVACLACAVVAVSPFRAGHA